MKIIKMGKINTQVTCEKCGCIYEYEDEDIRHDYSLTIGSSFVYCPCCGIKHNIWSISSPTYIPYSVPLTHVHGTPQILECKDTINQTQILDNIKEKLNGAY